MNSIKNYIFILSLLSFLLLFTNCKKDKISPDQEFIDPEELLPAAVGDHQIIEHSAYTLSYNEEHEQADWVAYVLTKQEVENERYDRTDDYRADPSVTSGSADLDDYYPTRYTYARGHLAPAADFKWSETAMSESFFLSNMSPMLHDFNGGKWMYLENEVRHWAKIYNYVCVVVGGVLSEGLPTIGSNGVSIPEYYYKIILDLEGEKGIAFIMPHENIEDTFKNYAVTIDEVETQTGIDFFPDLEDELEERIESTLNMSEWTFNYYK